MKVEMLNNDKRRETINDVTHVTMPCTETGTIVIETRTQKALRKIEDLICFKMTPVSDKTGTQYLTVTALTGDQPKSETHDMLRTVWFDKNYGKQKIYIEGFYDDDGKGKFHENLGDVLVTNRTIKPGNIKL